ncbi:MAG: hypothetical protein J6Y77_07530 [Paludibacteraceae bacterium]|nr:hypothetical protein [Paludibacteraceae bacterium]
MKAKLFLILTIVGIAFLAVSLWVILSKGSNRTAVGLRCKLASYMLGAMSMLTATSCEGPTSPELYGPMPAPLLYGPCPYEETEEDRPNDDLQESDYMILKDGQPTADAQGDK